MKPAETWILNGILCTLNGRRTVRKAHLRILEDGRIDAITTRVPRRLGRRAVDATGLVLLPGFVQAHVHLCQTLFRNQADDLELLDWLKKKIWVMEAAHTADTLRVSALQGIYELLSSGTTCILDMGTVRHTESIFEAVLATGIRASVGKCLMDHPGRTPRELRDTSTEAALSEVESLFRKWHGRDGDRIRVSYAPRFALSCTEELLKEVARRARAAGHLIHTHASENQKEIAEVRRLFGAENIEYLHRLGLTDNHLVLAHCVWLNHQEIEILRKSGTHVAHCPSSNLKLASGIAPVPQLRAHGINVALGADGAPCNNNLNMFQEMRLAALIQKPGHGPKAMRAVEVLEMATLGGARALSWEDQIGSIEVGKKADLIALDLSQPENMASGMDFESIASSVVYSCQPAHVRTTWVNGKTVYRSGARGGVRGISRSELIAAIRKAQVYFRSEK